MAQTFKGFTTTNPGWIESKKALAEMVDLGKEYQYEFVVGIYPLLNELDDYQGKHAHDVIQAFCIAKEITCVDLLNIFDGKNEREYWINWADSHPNAEAHRMVADSTLPIVEVHLEEIGKQ